ncbi:MAG TPA: acyl-CoA dehydrogenase family protein [Burkholderiales bacterium]|nr:acyl-CoA dehydrogenase family protein [Burkholderiales bacterium]
MNFAIEDSAEQSAFRAEVREFLESAVSPNLEHSVDPCDMPYEQYSLRRELGRRLGSKGWLYPSMPQEYGGGELSAEKVVILHDEMARIGLSLPPYYDGGGRMSAPTILVWGTPEHKKRFLTPICRGDVRTWQLLTEPGAGSDLAGIKTTAIRDGDAYVVNGQKIFVGSSHGADFSWTIVVTDPKGERHKNLSWLMIPMDLPGITVTPMDLLATGGEGGSGSGVKNTIFFDNVRVPAENLVGGENNGWKVATTHLEVEHGGMGRLADRRVVYDFIQMCRERHDGYAIADDPDARAELVDLYIEAEVTRLFALRNHWLAHTNQPRSYEGAQYSLRRKLSGLDMAEKMLRIAGPRVLTKDAKWAPLRGNIEYFQRDAITALHPGATTDIQRVVISRRIGIGGREKEKAGALK